MMKLLLVGIALCSLCVRAQSQGQCKKYRQIREQYQTCKGDEIQRQDQNYSADILYTNVKLLCKNRRAIVECMREAFGACSNIVELITFTKNGFDFCDMLEVDSVMARLYKEAVDWETYCLALFLDYAQQFYRYPNIKVFERNAGNTVTRTCLLSVFNEVMRTHGGPKPHWYRVNEPSLETRVSNDMRFYTWYISKFMLTDLDEALDVCDGMTRRAVFGIFVASLNVQSGWGLDIYEEFTNLVQGDVGMFNLPA